MDFRSVLSLVWFLANLAIAASTPQLCYTDAGKLAPDDIVPCFTAKPTLHYSCCHIGDKCLYHNACYDQGTGNTYQYGCTDPEYKDESVCPSKCGLSREMTSWVGLVFCNGAHGLPNNTWVCHHPDNCKGCAPNAHWAPELQILGHSTYCEDLRHDGQYVAFEEVGTISDLVPLPTNIASYLSDYSDKWNTATQTEASTATATTSLASHSQLSGSAGPTTTGTTSPSLARPKSYDVALGVGLGVGVPVVLTIAGLVFFCYRKHRSQPEAKQEFDGAPVDRKGPDDGDGVYKYGYRAELSGIDRPVYEAPRSPEQVTEMEGSTVGERTPL